MMLFSLLLIPFAGAVISWFAGRHDSTFSRWLALASMIAELIVSLFALGLCYGGACRSGGWFLETNVQWFPQLGVSLHLGVDGINLLLLILTALLGSIAILASWREIRENVGFFHFNLLLILTGVIGAFLSLDLFVFYIFWELMLVPMYFLILSWGHENRAYAAVKFFIYTQAGGLFLLISILGLVFIHQRATGVLSFDYAELMGTSLGSRTGAILFCGFLAAFLVKLPAVPFHAWLADAHTEAPTGGSVILAGLLLKTGAYGLIRFAVPLFPDAAVLFAPYGMVLAVAGIVYGAAMAFAQNDLKRFIAYTSISHMGFVLLGICAWNNIGLQGVMIQIICHGLGTGALFVLAGLIQERIHTRDLFSMGGFWKEVPRMGAIWLFFSLATIGLPGLGTFIGEFLVLLGAYPVSIIAVIIAATGLVFATVYALSLVWRIYFGSHNKNWSIDDISGRELAPVSLLAALLIFIGLFPQPLLTVTATSIGNLTRHSVTSVANTPATRTPLKAVSFLRSGDLDGSQ